MIELGPRPFSANSVCVVVPYFFAMANTVSPATTTCDASAAAAAGAGAGAGAAAAGAAAGAAAPETRRVWPG